mgnify:CR=1 FL=1
MIFNKGGWKVDKKWGECKDHVPKQLGQISGTKIKGKELVLMINGRLHKAGGDDGMKCGWKFKGAFHQPWYDCLLENWAIPKRTNINKEIIEELKLLKEKMIGLYTAMELGDTFSPHKPLTAAIVEQHLV